ncbi:3'-5' exonuclease [Streptomyces sp. NPDC087440]|uniref:3'-5' exonuclease n=1 Tax=Streptomyces sp. NPDC087440 TaxID=3365790 RepID=UPI0037F63F1C
MTTTTSTTDAAPLAGTQETGSRVREWQVPEALGARRIADLLVEHTEEPVTAADVAVLVEREHLAEVGSYKGWPMYSTGVALALDVAVVRAVVADRVAWEEVSLPRDAAAERIGWHWGDLARMGEEGRITTGRGDRYLIADLDRLAEEADGEQYVTAQAAARDVLEIRPTDWKYVEAAGWITPAETYEKAVGRTRTVTVCLYRLGEVRDLLDMPGVDWEAARGLPRRAPSPLREYARLAPTRAAAVKGFAQRLADRHQVTVWAWSSPYSGGWELDWQRTNGRPTAAQVGAELAADPEAGTYAQEITLCPVWGRITRRARELLEPGAAVVLDTETTDLYGQTVEIAVIDAATGTPLLDTLVRPTVPIEPGAYWVHGIADADVADACPFEKILPKLRKVTRDRVICAYNADFDRTVVLGDVRRAKRKPMHLETGSWWCLMDAYAKWLGSDRWLRLGGSHRAAGDCQAARDVLLTLAEGRGAVFTPRDPACPPAGARGRGEAAGTPQGEVPER